MSKEPEHSQVVEQKINAILKKIPTGDLKFLMEVLAKSDGEEVYVEGARILLGRLSTEGVLTPDIPNGTRIRIKMSQGRYSGMTGVIIEKSSNYLIQIDRLKARPVAFNVDQFILLDKFKEGDLVLCFSYGNWIDAKYYKAGVRSGEHVVKYGADNEIRGIIKDEIQHWS